MKPEPTVRRDGCCRQCRGPRRNAKPNRYSGLAAVADPFCSTQCARAWYGTELPVARAQGRRGYLAD